MCQPPTTPGLNPALQNWLIEQEYNPADLEQPGCNGDTALMQATRTGEASIVQSLLQAGANVNAKNQDGNNALWFACFGDRDDLIQQLVAAGIDLNNQNDQWSNSSDVCSLSR